MSFTSATRKKGGPVSNSPLDEFQGLRVAKYFFARAAKARGRLEPPEIHSKTSPQHNFCVRTRHAAAGYFGTMTKALQHANAFVIQFREPAGTRAEKLPGRVEHVASGRTASFQTVEELPQLLRKMLTNEPAEKRSENHKPACCNFVTGQKNKEKEE
jgi:hypothetical protein